MKFILSVVILTLILLRLDKFIGSKQMPIRSDDDIFRKIRICLLVHISLFRTPATC